MARWQMKNEHPERRSLAMGLERRDLRVRPFLARLSRPGDHWDLASEASGELTPDEVESETINLGQECSRENRLQGTKRSPIWGRLTLSDLGDFQVEVV